jgi:hypothetical protein
MTDETELPVKFPQSKSQMRDIHLEVQACWTFSTYSPFLLSHLSCSRSGRLFLRNLQVCCIDNTARHEQAIAEVLQALLDA